MYTPQLTAEQRHTHLRQHTTETKRIVVTRFGVQWRAKWAWSKAQRRLNGNNGDKGRSGIKWNWRRSRPQILPIRQTGSPQKAVLLTRRLMEKLITSALYSSEGSTSFQPLLILLSCCCEALSLTVRVRETLAHISLPAHSTKQGLEDQDSF